MLLVVNNFTEFFFKKRAGLAFDETGVTAHGVFDFEGYLNQCRESDQPFMQEFIKTQAFTNFVETAFIELNNPVPKLKHKTDITYFQKCIGTVLKESYKTLQNKQIKRIKRHLKNFRNPVTLYLDECYALYETALKNSAKCGTRRSSTTSILDHSKIVRMEKFNPQTNESNPTQVSPKQAIAQRMALYPSARLCPPRHVKYNTTTMNMQKNGVPLSNQASVYSIADRKCGQQRMPTQLPAPPPSLPSHKSHSPPMRVFHERSPTNMCGAKFNAQQSPLKFLKNYCPPNKENITAGPPLLHKNGYHSPQFGSRKGSKGESIDSTSTYFAKKVTNAPATSNASPMARASIESNREKSVSVIGATDQQLTLTINQVQNISHPSNVSNRTTADSSRNTKSRFNSSNLFEQCGGLNNSIQKPFATPKTKDIKSYGQLSVKIGKTKNFTHKSMSGSEIGNLPITKTVQSKSRNLRVGTNDSSTNGATLDPKCKLQQRFNSPTLSHQNSIGGNRTTHHGVHKQGPYNTLVTPNPRSRIGTMLSEDTSKISEEPDGDRNDSFEEGKHVEKKLQMATVKPPRRETEKPVARYQGVCTPGVRLEHSSRTKIEEKACGFRTLQYESLVEIEEEPSVPQQINKGQTSGANMSERGLSTRVHSHQGDDDMEPYII